MSLPKNLFICFCMVVIATSMGFALWANLTITLAQAMAAASGVLALEITLYMLTWKSVVHRAMSQQIQDLVFAETENADQLEKLRADVQKLRLETKNAVREEMDPLFGELEVIGTLVNQIAENSVELDSRLHIFETEVAPPSPLPKKSEKRSDAEFQRLDRERDNELSDAYGPQERWDKQASHAPELDEKADHSPDPVISKAVNQALDRNEIDLYLQPIVNIPQRKPVYYEALSRLKTEDGLLIRPEQYGKIAERSGSMPVLDKMQLIRAIQVLRKLMARKSDAMIICNISASSLADVVFFEDFRRLLRAKHELASHIIFQFSQKTIQDLGPVEEESLRALKTMGFAFSMDHVRHLNIDYRRLSTLGFHFIKTRLHPLIAARKTGVNDIHVDDLSRFLARNGIQLIVDDIENEAQVIELLNFEVGLAQGRLFGGPREVKAEIIETRPRPDHNRLAS